jgi:hypothetical protein
LSVVSCQKIPEANVGVEKLLTTNLLRGLRAVSNN